MQVACRGVTRIYFSYQPAFTFSFGAAFFAPRKMVGVTGFEPVTLRLSSACSNQLSYTPTKSGLPSRSSERFSNRATHCPPSLRYSAVVPQCGTGGAEETRTPDL